MEHTPIPEIALRGPYSKSIDHVYDELARIELLVRAQVINWRLSSACAGPENAWGMVVVTEAEVDRYLAAPISAPGALSVEARELVKPLWERAAELRAAIDRFCSAGSSRDLRLLRLARLFELERAEIDILLLCLLSEVDDRHRRLFGYLQNDASRQSLHTELIAQILRGSMPQSDSIRDLLSPFGRLLAHRLVVFGNDPSSTDSGLALRPLRIDDRIAAFLLGTDTLDPRLAGIVRIEQNPAESSIYVREETAALLDVVRDSLAVRVTQRKESVRLLLLGPDPRLAAKIAQFFCHSLRIACIEFDVATAIRSNTSWEAAVDAACREALLLDAALFFRNCTAVLIGDQERARWEYLELAAAGFVGLTVVECDSSEIHPGVVSDARFWQIDILLPDYATRKSIWGAQLSAVGNSSFSDEEETQLAAELANAFQTTEAQIEDAIAGAHNLARRRKDYSGQVEINDLYDACRRLAGRKLVAFAQRIEPRRNLSTEDVVLPEPNKRQLLDLSNRIRYHRELFHATRFDQVRRLGKGLLALFAGTSGTGKTLAAEALASGQGVDLYKVDLSAVVSKWVGETEKNLSRIFAEAESSNGWLFFDEGESLFGSRGDIKQAQDRLFNLEVNYLLQRIEEFSGVVILATNLRQNIDDAFLRRIHAVVEFPQPNAQLRFTIWKKLMPVEDRRDFKDEQLRKLAARFELSGGNIRNAVLDAMFRAYGSEEKSLTLRHVAVGIAREYQKMGRPISSTEFGDVFYQWLVEDILNPQPHEQKDARVAAVSETPI